MSIKNAHKVRELPVCAATTGPNHHFLSYYDVPQYDASGRYILGIETTFKDLSPAVDRATVGLIGLENNYRGEPLAEIHAGTLRSSFSG